MPLLMANGSEAIYLIASEPQTSFQRPQAYQESATKQSQLFTRFSHWKQGWAHEQLSKESKGNQ